MDFAPIPPCYLSFPPEHSKIGHCSQIQLEVTSPPPEGGGFDLRLKSPKDLASDAGDSLDRLSHSARRPLP